MCTVTLTSMLRKIYCFWIIDLSYRTIIIIFMKRVIFVCARACVYIYNLAIKRAEFITRK